MQFPYYTSREVITKQKNKYPQPLLATIAWKMTGNQYPHDLRPQAERQLSEMKHNLDISKGYALLQKLL